MDPYGFPYDFPYYRLVISTNDQPEFPEIHRLQASCGLWQPFRVASFPHQQMR